MVGAWKFLGTFAFALIGACLVAAAIRDFKNKHYFGFGMDIMMCIITCVYLCLITASTWVY